MYGPTYFRQIIEQAAKYSSQGEKGKDYFVWIIITDGEISDLEDTVAEICQGSKLPMSIVILGVWEGEPSSGFSSMEFLDSDNQPLQSKDGKFKSDRDIVQFVEAEKYKHNPTLMYQKVLEEIPEQVETYMRNNNISP